MNKSEELTQEAMKKGKPDTYFPKAEIFRIIREGLKLFLKKIPFKDFICIILCYQKFLVQLFILIMLTKYGFLISS